MFGTLWGICCVLHLTQSLLLLCTWSKSHFMWLITINWKCSATKMFRIVTLQSCGVLTVQLGPRSCCWPTALSLWTALLCLLCRADTFMFITQNQDFESVYCTFFKFMIILFHNIFFFYIYLSFLSQWLLCFLFVFLLQAPLVFINHLIMCWVTPGQPGECNKPAGRVETYILFSWFSQRKIGVFIRAAMISQLID